MAWLAEDADTCGGCGHPMAETTAAGERYDPTARYAGDQVRCEACEAIENQRVIVREQGGSLAGLKVFAYRST